MTPTDEALADQRAWQRGVRTFSSPDAFFIAVLGPPQHDAHVECFKGDRWLRERREGAVRGLAACNDWVDQMRLRRAMGWRQE